MGNFSYDICLIKPIKSKGCYKKKKENIDKIFEWLLEWFETQDRSQHNILEK